MVKHALKLAALAVGMVVTMGAYWATSTDQRLDTLEAALITLARIEAKVDMLLQKDE
jgi:hypothetical protein